ncbi:hypothetical protein YC2023_025654 [Brassica napus]
MDSLSPNSERTPSERLLRAFSSPLHNLLQNGVENEVVKKQKTYFHKNSIFSLPLSPLFLITRSLSSACVVMVAVKEKRNIEEGLLKLKNPNDDPDCRITACVIFSTFLTVCGSFSFGVAIGYTSGAEIGMIKDMDLSIAEFSAFGSFCTLGGTFGALLSGKMAIVLGRRGTMWVADILCVIGWLCIAFAKVPVYIAEITPKHVRGTCTFSTQVLYHASFKESVYSSYQSPQDGWLAKVGADKELENSLLRLRGKDVDISREASEIQVMTKMLESDSKSSFSNLFQRKYRHTLVVQSVGCTGFSVAIGSTLLAIFMNFHFFGLVLALNAVYGYSQVPKAMIGVIFVDKWGRRPLLLLYLAAYAIGVGGLPWVIMSEIFPMNMKVTAGSLVTLASWSSSSIVTYAFNFLFEWSTRGTFYIFGAIAGAALVFIWLFVPETKGLSLEEIQTSLIREPDEIYHM